MRKVVSNLKKKGFQEQEGDHRYLAFYQNGIETAIYTKVSRGSGHEEIDGNLISAMSKQLGLKKEQFLKFVECTMTEEEYLNLDEVKDLLSGASI